MVDDAYTRNEDGELAVRTVSTSGDTGTNPNDVFTRDDEGRLAIRTTGGGGGDQHNLGYFATQAALEEAYPTAEAGDWAIVGATDTVWLWDSDNSEWVDSDQKGQVTSVNGQTGDVTLTIPEAVQYDTMPTASADNLGDIVQFIGTTDANYTNGYFYKCVSDGQDPATYSWTRVDVQPTPSGLPDQTGQSGKFLTTDGTSASWGNALVNNVNSEYALGLLKSATASSNGVAIGWTANSTGGVSIGQNSKSSSGVGIGVSARANANYSIAVGQNAQVGNSATGAIQFNTAGGTTYTNNDANTFKVANANGNFEIMSADGTIPADRLTHAINKYSTMPTAASTNEGWIVQFTGTTDSTYTHGYLYECKAQGTDPETYAWEEVSLGGGSSYTAGTGIDITNDVISVTSPVLVNKARNPSSAIAIGQTSEVNTNGIIIGPRATGTTYTGQIVIGNLSGATDAWGVAIGYNAHSTAEGAIQLSGAGNAYASAATNSESYTFKVCLGTNTDGSKNYKLLDSDGTIPEARLADTTNAQQGDVLTLDSNGNAVWQAGGGGGGLPDQTGQSGKFLTTDGTNASWSDKPITNKSSSTSGIAIGRTAQCRGDYSVCIGDAAVVTQPFGIALGSFATTSAMGTIQINASGNSYVNSDANTFKVANLNGNFELMDANGNLPADRLASTTGLADGNYRLRCTITNGVPTLSWVAE